MVNEEVQRVASHFDLGELVLSGIVVVCGGDCMYVVCMYVCSRGRYTGM